MRLLLACLSILKTRCKKESPVKNRAVLKKEAPQLTFAFGTFRLQASFGSTEVSPTSLLLKRESPLIQLPEAFAVWYTPPGVSK